MLPEVHARPATQLALSAHGYWKNSTFENLTKKEIARLMKERTQLEKNLGGIKEMKELPGIVFIIDTRKESIAVTEARKVTVPIVAVVDTNCNPEGITFPIPGNDDAIRAINLFAQIIANAVIEAENEVGLEVVETLQEEKGEEEFAEAIDKGEFAAQSKYDQEEVEKVPVAAVIGAAHGGSRDRFHRQGLLELQSGRGKEGRERACPRRARDRRRQAVQGIEGRTDGDQGNRCKEAPGEDRGGNAGLQERAGQDGR